MPYVKCLDHCHLDFHRLICSVTAFWALSAEKTFENETMRQFDLWATDNPNV